MKIIITVYNIRCVKKKQYNGILDLYNKEKIRNSIIINWFGTPPTYEDGQYLDYISKDKIKEKIEDKISICRCEELEDMGLNDVHGKYWSMYRRLLEKLLKELLEE